MNRFPSRTVLFFFVCVISCLMLQACSFDIDKIPIVSELAGLPDLLIKSIRNKQSYSSSPSFSSRQEIMVRFLVQVPEAANFEKCVYLTTLDEVTGLGLNPKHHLMQNSDSEEGIFYVDLPLSVGSVVKYRYELQMDTTLVAEHLSDGTPVRYRLYQVNGTGNVVDVVSRWTNTAFRLPSGRIMGEALDAYTGQPVPNLLITAGGAQTITNANGSFVIEGLPPGIHNLVAYALDGSHKTFQQGARIAPDSTTPANLELISAPLVDVTFTIHVPTDTPPVIPVRIAGNLYQLGNTYADLAGGINSLSVKMPTLNPLPDGRYQITISLPEGSDVRYKYTLGDGFWNAEHSLDGVFRLRQLIVPGEDIEVEDKIDTWKIADSSHLIFDVTVPETTPEEDFVSIQFRPIFGWTEPIPMWNIGENRWAFILYSPLNLPGGINYRYCRNNQCGKADDAATQGFDAAGREMPLNQISGTFVDRISSWVGLDYTADFSEEHLPPIISRQEDFWSGIELVDDYHPSWTDRMPDAVAEISAMGSNWLIIDPTWSFGHSLPGNNPPILEPIAGKDALWFDLIDNARIAYESNLNVAVFPIPRFQIPIGEWWQSSPRDYAWWLIWFDQYRQFILHHADLANHMDAHAIILGGTWISPALPEGRLPDGNFSQAPGDAEIRWRDLISEVRDRYHGEVVWAVPAGEIDVIPSFIDVIDKVYVLGPDQRSNESGEIITVEMLGQELPIFLDTDVKSLHMATGKPVILGVSYPSIPDMETQYEIYNLLLNELNQRQWISGFISRGYYPPAALQDDTASIHGKSASYLLSHWFKQLWSEPNP